MDSFTTSTVSNNLVSRELGIASSFVKQYYTLLNKAPCFIHNFYSHDSTFIHGTIEMANEHYTEPVVGREKIKSKMEDLKLNDCRAKIKQIDCLETLASGLVIQVIGELSNNGKPMRRFLQTFVLAPSPSEPRQDCDSQAARKSATDKRNVHLSENSSQSHNQKFYVLNSIFRYQDDGTDSEFEDEASSIQAGTFTESNNGGEMSKVEPTPEQTHNNLHFGSGPEPSQNRRRHVEAVRNVDEVEKLSIDLEENVKFSRPTNEGDHRRDVSGTKVVPNGTGSMDKKNETSEKTTENGKAVVDQPQVTNSGSSGQVNINQPVPSATTSRPPTSNEPKTWANMVRNAHPPSIQPTVGKAPLSEQLHQNVSQSQPGSTPVQQQPQPQQQQSQQQQQQQQPQQQQPQLQQQQSQLQQNSQNNRRRHTMRKPANKSVGRTIKNRPPRPPIGKPAA